MILIALAATYQAIGHPNKACSTCRLTRWQFGFGLLSRTVQQPNQPLERCSHIEPTSPWPLQKLPPVKIGQRKKTLTAHPRSDIIDYNGLINRENGLPHPASQAYLRIETHQTDVKWRHPTNHLSAPAARDLAIQTKI
jgi:hypothetical protein